jgi:hypothetical protein
MWTGVGEVHVQGAVLLCDQVIWVQACAGSTCSDVWSSWQWLLVLAAVSHVLGLEYAGQRCMGLASVAWAAGMRPCAPAKSISVMSVGCVLRHCRTLERTYQLQR